MIWLENIKTFFVDNAQAILAWLTPTNIAATITAVVMIIRNYRATKKNTQASTGLIGTIDKVTNLSDTVKANSDVVSCQVETIRELSAKYDFIVCKIADVERNLTDKFDIIDQRLEAMLNVQSMVYSTIQNNDLRMNIQNTIANAKLAADGTRTELKKQIETLKKEVNTIVENVNEKVEATTGAIIEAVDNKKIRKSAKRY